MKRLLLILIVVWLCGVVSAQSIFRLQYWFDGQHDNVVTALSSNGKWQTPIETNQLPNGFHTLYIQVQDSTEQWFSPRSFFFYRVPDTMTNQGVRYTYWFDNDSEHLFSDSISTGHLLLDASMLTDGFHTVNFQFIFSNSASFKSYLFYKTPSFPNATDSIEYVFWFDQDFDHRQSGFCLQEHLVFDIDSLSTGFHTLNAQFIDGNNTTFKSFQFYKRPHNEIQIVKYEYWFNDQDSLKQIIPITPQDTFDLVTLMPAPAIPIRSTYFHFNPNNGNPLVNAKNDIHFRVYNAKGYTLSRTKTYYDVTVVDTVYADTLERNTTQTIAAPTNNHIHWFKLGVGIGDSLSFRTDKLCTMQLYAPSGEMVFHASNDSVLTWDGCHAWEQGDYYLAIHDATDTGTISVSYQWIYRYAVLAWDVHRVGNGGVSTITFEGNGFSSLDTMFLVRGTDTIPTLYINRESNTTVSIYFNFEGIDTGMFNGAFVYVDEVLYKTDVVYVEEARPIVLTTTCSYPLQFLMGDVVTYTYTITNMGNMMAYNIPLLLNIVTPNFEDILHVSIEGLGLESLYDIIKDIDSLSGYDENQLKEICEKIGDEHYFVYARELSENGIDSVSSRYAFFFTSIAPYASKTISINIIARSEIETWLSVPDTWKTTLDSIRDESKQSYYVKSNNKSSLQQDIYCCWHTKIEAILDMVALDASITSLVAACFGPEAYPVAAVAEAISCVAGAVSELSSVYSTFVCDSVLPTIPKILLMTAVSPIKIALGCLNGLGKVIDIIKTMISAGWNFYDFVKITQTEELHNPNCPPIPPPGGHSYPWISIDPNEITGYIAESGSLSVSAEQMQMPYVIEFENDTTLATANAHTIVVKDTLDGTVFDLNSMSATAFSIGEHLETVNSGQSFVRTVDMRPAIDIIAQVRLDYHIDTTFAIATWTFSSLDPLTLLPTSDPTLGILPPNFNGDGVGEVNFTINRKANLPDSTLIRNRAWITFDNEDPIPTSVWTNIMDVTPPESQLITFTDSTGEQKMGIVATDNLSGVWRYNLYGQRGDVNLLLNANIPADSALAVDTTLDYDSYYSLAVDSAGNMETLHSQIPHYTLTAIGADSTMGTVTGSGTYIEGDTALLTVHANCGFHFLRWADNVTDNPRQVVVWSDTTLLAIFEADSNVVLFETYCDSYTWQNGMTYTSSGTYYDTLTNAAGCDSVVTLHLTINYSNTGDTNAVACDSFDWYEYTNLTQSGEYTHTFTNVAGCDSVVTLHLTVNYSNTGDTTAVACNSFDWYEYTNLTQSGDYVHTFTNVAGCDSVVTLHLTVNYSNTGDTTAVACNSFDWYEHTNLTQSGDYVRTFTNATGCDSVVTLHLTVNYSDIGDTTAIACDFFDWYEYTHLTQSGDYTRTITNATGCDSVVTLHLTINYSNTGDTTAVVCNSFDWYELTDLTQSGDYTRTVMNAAGCDSVVTLHLTVNYSNTGDTTAVVCDSFDWYEYTNLTQSGEYAHTFTNAAGCDSVVTLHLTVNYSNTGDTTAVVCDSFDWYEYTNLTQSGDYTHTFTNVNGCDSAVTLHLTVNSPVASTISATACDSYTWNGETYTTSGDYTRTLTNANGCDSVVTLHLTINPSETSEFAITTPDSCYIWNSQTYCTSGDYTQTLQTVHGCDSVVTLHLTITVGIDDHNLGAAMTVYPNPTTSVVNVECTMVEGQAETVEFQLFDAFGRLLRITDGVETRHDTSLQTAQIDLSHYATGVYFIKAVADGNVVAVRKVIRN